MQYKIVRRPEVNSAALSSLHPVIQKIYLARGIESESQLARQAVNLLHFSQLSGMQGACDILYQAIVEHKKILICGDFDADGATSTAVMIKGLRLLGTTHCDYLVPNRFDFGYGLSPALVELAYQHRAEVIVTVDSGISCLAGVQRAKELGMQVIVTDHHLPGAVLPQADAIVNPNLHECEFPSKALAGVGVAFYLLLALRDKLRREGAFQANPPNLATLLDLVALGTVADVVPLDDNNRILVYQGLQRIRAGKACPGIQALIEIANREQAQLVAADFGFALGPRLNAAGRLDDMSRGIRCLLAEDLGEARMIAAELDSLNKERREIEQSMVQDAELVLGKAQFSEGEVPDGIALYDPTFHQGVIGIVAGRIKEKHHRPVIAFAQSDEHKLKGSARSIPGLHMRDLLESINSQHPGLINKFGGHAMAAGLEIDEVDFSRFEQIFAEQVAAVLEPGMLEGEVLSDGSLDLAQMEMDMALLIREAGPWGQAFPEPVFDDEFELIQQRLVGDKHLKVMLARNGKYFDGIQFNIDLSRWPNEGAKRVHVAYKLDINRFRGKESLQLMIEQMTALAD